MGRKSKKQNKPQIARKTGKDKKIPGGKHIDSLPSHNASPEAQEFIRNLGPPGYIRAADSLCKDIAIERFSMSTPDGATPLLENTSIKISSGRRYALIGRNGFGKTTLLSTMASYQIESFPAHIRMLLVHQECEENDGRQVTKAVLEADTVRSQLLAESERLEELMYSQDDDESAESIQTDLDYIASHMDDLQLKNSHAKAFRILSGLGFSREMQKQSVSSLSGGWRMRVELAKALFIEPDLLLLDEPTNHLDFPAVLWLEEYLKRDFRKTLIVVSHDKLFLDEVATHSIHLDHLRKTLSYYKGNYSAFEAARKESNQALENAYRSHEVQIASLEEFVEKFKDKGEKRAAQVQSKLKTLQKLKDSIPMKLLEEKRMGFSFPEPSRLEQHLVLFNDVTFGYSPGVSILDNVNLAVDIDSRIGVIGANGVGKSTLVKLMLGKLKPTRGEIEREPKAKFAFFSQHHYEQLDLNVNAVEYFLERFSEGLKQKPDRVQFVRRYLGRFEIKGDRQNQRIGLLSGGQKSRVAFAAMTFETPHFIIMDEPTNHLDVESVDALIDAISKFKGGILTVSHDTHFLSRVAKEFWSVTRDEIVRFDEFEDAKEFALQMRVGEVDAALKE